MWLHELAELLCYVCGAVWTSMAIAHEHQQAFLLGDSEALDEHPVLQYIRRWL